PPAPARQQTARALPHGRQRAAGSATVLSSESHTARSLASANRGRSGASLSAGAGPPSLDVSPPAGVWDARRTTGTSAGRVARSRRPGDNRPTTIAMPRPIEATQAPDAGLRRAAIK